MKKPVLREKDKPASLRWQILLILPALLFAQQTITGTSNGDVGILRIIAPPDTVDSNTTVFPICWVANYSMIPGSFWTYCEIGNYRDSAWVADLAPVDSAVVNFAPWTADTAGTISVLFQTALPGDLNPDNDTASKNFFVRPSLFNDVAAIAVLAPEPVVIESTLINPRVVVRNNGLQPATFKVYCQIRALMQPVFFDSLTHHLSVQQTDTVEFPSWLATPGGAYLGTFWVFIENDINPNNDTIQFTLMIQPRIHDVGTVAIIIPGDTVEPGPVPIKAKIANFGTFSETGFPVQLTVSQSENIIYSEALLSPTIAPNETILLSFPTWNAEPGYYTIACSTALAQDQINHNNRLLSRIAIQQPPPPAGWQEMTPVPQSPSNKPLKDGTALTYLQNRVYLLRGNKTDDFLCYDIDTDTWLALKNIPPSTADKPVYKGGDLTSDNSRYIYATKGHSSVDFFRYDILLDTWERKKEIPLGPTRKPIKGGNKMVFVSLPDGDYIYLLKGNKNEFWRYNVFADTWEPLPNAPLGTSGKNAYKDGSFLVYDGTSRLFAVKAKYGELFAFDLYGNQWLNTTYRNFPEAGMLGKKKKVKAGAGGDWWNGGIFCLKGGNTNEFWRFFPDSGPGGRWQELETIPQLGSTQKKKRVKAGGGIVGTGNGIFFAVKGNKTYEFWRYRSSESGPGVEEKLQPPVVSGRLTLKLYPNPAKELLHIRLNQPVAGKALITVYDATGRERYRFITRSSQFTINCHNWAPGIYLIRAQTRALQTTAKIIVH